MKIASSALAVFGIAASAAAGAVVTTGPAAAGTNGQHVAVAAGGYTDVKSVRVWGTDQNGNFAETPTRAISNDKLRQALFPEYWFKGNVTVRYYFYDGHTSEKHYNVPVSYPTDWYWLNY
jgi:hypothetical protein